MPLLIRNGIVIDPVTEAREVKDILVEQGKITSMGKGLPASGAEVIDATEKFVAPGLIDMHVHLREPGFEAKETIKTGTLAALRGGFTTVACMPNTEPVADNAPVIEFILNKAREAGNAKVYPIGAITSNSKGKELAPMAELKEAGAVAFSDDGQPVVDAGLMRRAMEYASMLDAVIISHCEDPNLAAGGAMHEGTVSTTLGLKGIPASAEEVMVARDVILARETGCRLHIAHVSTAGSVQIIREAKALGIKVTAETTPHHFTLTHTSVHGYNTATKVNPPLRTEADVEAIKEGLADGTIDVIATDHAPHAGEEKNVEYDMAPFGLVGLETAVGLVWSQLVGPGVLTVEQAVSKLTVNPARILNINAGSLKAGVQADITLIDPGKEWEVNPQQFTSKGRNTPFAGWKLTGQPVMTLVNGVKL